MPRKKKEARVAEAPVRINPDVLQELVPGPMSAAAVESIFQHLKKALLERALNSSVFYKIHAIAVELFTNSA